MPRAILLSAPLVLSCCLLLRAEPQEVLIPVLQKEAVAPPFADGDEVTLWCAGALDGNRFLTGAPTTGQVTLSPTTDGTVPGTHWRVQAHADGTVSLRCISPGAQGSGWLNGLTDIEDARVLLCDAPDAHNSGAFWKVYALGQGEFALRCQGDRAGVRWLNGYTPGGSVSLVPETTGHYTGAHWKIQVVASVFPGPGAVQPAPEDGGCELSLWNQHNGDYRDRGTDVYQVEAFHAGASVWRSPELHLAWSPLNDPLAKVMIPLPRSGLDEVRVSILRWIGHGGGLSEVRLSQGGHDLTGQCKVSVSGVFEEDPRFSGEHLGDGITTSEAAYTGYWLLPDDQPGFVRIQLPPP